MDITIIPAKSFKQRSDLEVYISKQFGLTTKKKVNVIINGTKHELTNLGLSEKMIFWGIPCAVVDELGRIMIHGEAPSLSLVDRGEKKPFGINGSTTQTS